MKDQPIKVKTGINQNFLSKIITKDINALECILDLIDNSIDSATNRICTEQKQRDDKGMPADYSGFCIKINITLDAISIFDNCEGISTNDLRSRLLVIGQESNKALSIGHFGVGLKRALLKLGGDYLIETRHKGSFYRLNAKESQLLDGAAAIDATLIDTKNIESFTLIKISDLKEAAIRETCTEEWLEEFNREVSIRYSIFIQKGLCILVNEKVIHASCPKIKSLPPVTIQKASFAPEAEVQVFIEAGMHEEYYRVGDPMYSSKEIESITGEYGWYYVCNDRVIKIATREHRFGWGKKWHNEYYGFVGWVYFVGSVAKIPWNTKKTDIDPSNPIFESIKNELKVYADTYRTQNRGLKKGKTGKSLSTESEVRKENDRMDASTEDVTAPESKIEDKNNNLSLDNETKSENLETKPNLKAKADTKIRSSDQIVEKLNELNSLKLKQLYNSLCKISLVEHPALAQIGAWAFFESLSRLIFTNQTANFVANFNSEMNQNWYKSNPKVKQSMSVALTKILDEGNCDKHCSTYVTIDAKPLGNHFEVLEPLILLALEKAISKKSSTSGSDLSSP